MFLIRLAQKRADERKGSLLVMPARKVSPRITVSEYIFDRGLAKSHGNDDCRFESTLLSRQVTGEHQVSLPPPTDRQTPRANWSIVTVGRSNGLALISNLLVVPLDRGQLKSSPRWHGGCQAGIED